jgi:hypothetical protein
MDVCDLLDITEVIRRVLLHRARAALSPLREVSG